MVFFQYIQSVDINAYTLLILKKKYNISNVYVIF